MGLATPLFIKFDLQPNSEIIFTKINHKSATANPEHVQQYINEEIAHDAMLGPSFLTLCGFKLSASYLNKFSINFSPWGGDCNYKK